MSEIFGVFGAQSFVVLIVAVVALVPVVLYYQETFNWFIVAYAFLFVAAFATNFENVFLPEIMNLVEHSLGNLAAGFAFAIAAYLYRKRNIVAPEAVTQETER